jgi:hypothetical protein
VATSAPTPGICRNRTQAASLLDLLQILAQALDLSLQMFPFLPKKIQQAAHAGRQLLLGVLQNLRHLPSQAGRHLPKTNPALQGESPNLIDDGGASRGQPIPYPSLLRAQSRREEFLCLSRSRRLDLLEHRVKLFRQSFAICHCFSPLSTPRPQPHGIPVLSLELQRCPRNAPFGLFERLC